MRLNTQEPYQILYALSKHPQLGFLIDLVAVKIMNNGSLGLQSQKIYANTKTDFRLNENHLANLKLIEEINPETILKKFNPDKKEYKTADFYSRIFDKELEKKVRPYIEKRLVKIFQNIGNDSIYLEKDKNYTHKKLKIEETKASILFHFKKNDLGTNYFATIKLNQERLNLNINNSDIVLTEPALMLYENKLFFFSNQVDGKKIAPFINKKYILIPQTSIPVYYEKFVKPLIEQYDVFSDCFEIRTEKFRAKAILKITTFLDNSLCLALIYEYGNYQFSHNSNKMVSVILKKEEDDYVFHRVARSKDWENKMVEILSMHDFVQHEGAIFKSKKNATHLIELLNNHEIDLISAGFKIDQSNLKNKFFIGSTTLNLAINKQLDWFDLEAVVSFGDFKIPFIKLKYHILKGQKEFLLPDGNIAVIPEEWFIKYHSLMDAAIETNEGVKIKKHHFGILDALDIAVDNKPLISSRTFGLPKGLKCTLRNYQIEGYQWLQNLVENNLGACLSDDMGLGKTVQIIALLQYFKEKTIDDEQKNTINEVQVSLFAPVSNPLSFLKTLIVVPTGLIYNWKNELEKFSSLKVEIHTGYNRAKNIQNSLKKNDIILTSYGTLRNDIDLFNKIEFDFAIIDEAQAIKNPSSQTARNIYEIKAKHKIAITGTPIENTILDLWSIFNYINPNLLGNYHHFTKTYQEAIEKNKNEEKTLQLKEIISPFLLRRTKDQVAKDLPSKTEKIIYCEMTEPQNKLYESVKNSIRNSILLNTDEAFNNQKFNILNGLMKLRQIANHPYLAEKEYKESSGKYESVIESAKKIIENGHKVLIFSQFVQHLNLFKTHFEENKTPFLSIDGSVVSKKRQELVDLFQKDPKYQIFFIQLKSGGSGLNLTAADYVFILDPWWNPAVERQAMDRTHRIGQNKPVIVYKFISKESIEEKIIHLQEKKNRVSDDILDINEQNVNNWDKKEIINLLET